jgi:predicted permease
MPLGILEKIFRGKRKASDFKAEVEAHLQLETERLREQGLSEEEAHNAACRAFGNVTKAQERFYESGHWLFWDSLWRDFRYSLHLLRKSPSFTLAAILTLAMAIGANAVVFSVMNALLVRPLGLPGEQSLFSVNPRTGELSYPDYLDLQARNRSFDGLTAMNVAGIGLDTGHGASLAWGWIVSGNYFDVLAVEPYIGRFFHSSDERGPNSAPYLVLSYAYWHDHFQDDPDIIGRTVQLNKHPFTIIGVASSEFHGTNPFVTASFYVPLVDQEQVEGVNNLNARETAWIGTIIGHIKKGVTPAQAMGDLNSVGSYLEKTYPAEPQRMTFSLEKASPFMGSGMTVAAQAFLGALLLLSGLILLAACANLGTLFSARAADRSREIALRLAMGSSRASILRQLFTEALVLSLTGGAVGTWFSTLLLQWLSAWHPLPRYPVQVAVNPDANVYALVLLLSLISGFVFGAVPVRQVLQTNPYGVIKSGSTRQPVRRITARDALLALQIALCAVLVTSSFVAVRGLMRSIRSDLGIEPQNALLADVDMNTAGYHADQIAVMQKRMLDAMATIPGVQAVGMTNLPPMTLDCCANSFVFNDRTTDLKDANAVTSATQFSISPDYFHAAGTLLLMGRTFTSRDDKISPRVAIINQHFARVVFDSETKAMNAYFKLPDKSRVQVVGIVEDGKYGAATEAPQPAMFLPILQSPATEAWLVLRSESEPRQIALAVRSKLHGLDPALVSATQTWSSGLTQSLFAPRMAALSLGVLGIMGALLSITGIFGMAASAVGRRKRDLGIRIALGAQPREVLQAALGRAAKLLAFGSAAGLLLGILASRVLASIVYDATPRDPMVLAGVVLAMALLGFLATWIPAQRALSIDPVMLLREE